MDRPAGNDQLVIDLCDLSDICAKYLRMSNREKKDTLKKAIGADKEAESSLMDLINGDQSNENSFDIDDAPLTLYDMVCL